MAATCSAPWPAAAASIMAWLARASICIEVRALRVRAWSLALAPASARLASVNSRSLTGKLPKYCSIESPAAQAASSSIAPVRIPTERSTCEGLGDRDRHPVGRQHQGPRGLQGRVVLLREQRVTQDHEPTHAGGPGPPVGRRRVAAAKQPRRVGLAAKVGVVALVAQVRVATADRERGPEQQVFVARGRVELVLGIDARPAGVVDLRARRPRAGPARDPARARRGLARARSGSRSCSRR